MRIGYNPYAQSNQSFGIKSPVNAESGKHIAGEVFDLNLLPKGEIITTTLVNDTLIKMGKKK